MIPLTADSSAEPIERFSPSPKRLGDSRVEVVITVASAETRAWLPMRSE